MPALTSILDKQTGRVIGYISERRDILGKYGYYGVDRNLLGGRQTKMDAANALRERSERNKQK